MVLGRSECLGLGRRDVRGGRGLGGESELKDGGTSSTAERQTGRKKEEEEERALGTADRGIAETRWQRCWRTGKRGQVGLSRAESKRGPSSPAQRPEIKGQAVRTLLGRARRSGNERFLLFREAPA